LRREIQKIRLFQKSFDKDIILTVILQPAKKLLLLFPSFQKTLKHEILRPQDDKERPNGVILGVSEESLFSQFLKDILKYQVQKFSSND
jgi:hypothetical protein